MKKEGEEGGRDGEDRGYLFFVRGVNCERLFLCFCTEKKFFSFFFLLRCCWRRVFWL